MNSGNELYLCYGTDCPLKEACLRYSEAINERTTPHLAYPPYDKVKDKCGLFIDAYAHSSIIVNKILNQ